MDVIVRVENIRSKVRITFESGWVVWSARKELQSRPLQAGMQVDPVAFRRFVHLCQDVPALDRAVAMLASRPCSTQEIRQKLRLLHYDDEVIAQVIEKLEKNNLLDDRDFAEQWIQSRIRKYGVNRIHQELRLKGVEEEITRSVTEEVPEELQLQNAVKLAEKKLDVNHQQEDPRKTYRRVTAFLVRRGYSWDLAKKAYEIASSNHSPE